MALQLHLFALVASLLPSAIAAPSLLGLNIPLTTQQLQSKQPLNGLPSNSDYSLVYSTLGIGHQNYTCNGAAFVQTEEGDGALAALYDTTLFLQTQPHYINRLSQHCNYKHCQFPYLTTDLTLLGYHYFSQLIQPTFNLTYAHPPRALSGVKTAVENAPQPTNVAWLYLTANPDNSITNGLKAVYRIDTFKGVAPASCSSTGQQISVPYTAQYWFYD